MPTLMLSTAQKRELKANAHGLKPVVLIGVGGLTPNVMKEIDLALTAHGLIKVQVAGDDRDVRHEYYGHICDELSCAPIGMLGKQLILWREGEDKEPSSLSPPRLAAKAGKAPIVVKVRSFKPDSPSKARKKSLTVLGNQRVTAGGTVKRAKKSKVSAKKRLG